MQALNRLGATRTMEGYLRFIQNLTATPPVRLQPCYGIDGDMQLDRDHGAASAGYRGMGRCASATPPTQQVQQRRLRCGDPRGDPELLR